MNRHDDSVPPFQSSQAPGTTYTRSHTRYTSSTTAPTTANNVPADSEEDEFSIPHLQQHHDAQGEDNMVPSDLEAEGAHEHGHAHGNDTDLTRVPFIKDGKRVCFWLVLLTLGLILWLRDRYGLENPAKFSI